MKYRVLIIGHAEFPQGVRSFLEFVGGFEEGIQHFF
ncbi:PTS sugar transporter subunit IIA, partial [Mycoplasmopsis pullorum]